MHSVLSRHWRQACRPISGYGTKLLNEDEVCTLLSVCTAQETLRVERVRQLCIVAEAGPGFLWYCLLRHQRWLSQALADAAHLQHTIGHAPLDATDAQAALHAIRQDVHSLRRLFRPYARTCIAQRAASLEEVTAKATRLADFEKSGGVLLHVPDSSESLFQCRHCSMSFAGRASRAAHESTVHGARSSVSVAAGSSCLVCRTEWWSTFRLREHLRRSPDCLSCYQHADLGRPESFEVTGTRSQRAWKPPTPFLGPTPWWTTLRPAEAPAPPDRTEVVPLDVPRDDAGLQTLVDTFRTTTWALWVPGAFRWVRHNQWDLTWLDAEHPMQPVMQILSSIAERTATGATVDSLHSPGVTATREGRVWYLSFG